MSEASIQFNSVLNREQTEENLKFPLRVASAMFSKVTREEKYSFLSHDYSTELM